MPTIAISAQAGCFEEEKYAEDFETGWASNWYLGPGFEIVSEGSGKALRGGSTSNSIATYLLGDYWTDFSFDFKMKLNAGAFRASLRYNSDGEQDYAYDRIRGKATDRYYAEFTSSSVILGRTEAGTDRTMRTATTSFNPDQPYAIRLVAVGGDVSVYVNDALLMSATDPRPISSGSIELETKPKAQVMFDDLQVVAKVPCEYTWTRTKTFPVGGDINVITVDPRDSNVVFAGTEHMGLWKSPDGGLTWAEVGYSGDMGRLGKTNAIAIAPMDTKVVYAAWGTGEVDRSIDRGLHWTRTNLMDTRIRFTGLAVSPSDPRVVYAALGDNSPAPNPQGIFKSSDGGESWHQLGFRSVALSLAISASAPDTLYVGSMDGIYKSTDGDTSWTKVYPGAGPGGVPSVAISPHDPNTIYAVADGTVRSTDGGKSWTKLRPDGNQVAVSPSDPDAVYLLTGSSIFKSTNRGQTWNTATLLTQRPYALKTIAVDSSNPNKVYAGTWGQGIFFSEDSGTTWREPNNWSVPADLGAAITVDPSDADKLYVGTSKGEVYVSNDKGGRWTWLGNLGTGAALKSLITGLVVDPHDAKIIYASNLEGVYKSQDGGAHWREIKNGLSDPRIISLALDPKNPTRLFAGTGNSKPRNVFEGSGMFTSTNGGESWSHVRGLPDAPIPAIVISPLDTNILYAAVMGVGVYKSVDGGAIWSQVNNGLENLCVYTLAIDAKDPHAVYAGTSSTYCKTPSRNPDNVYKTKNGGMSWEIVLKGEHMLDNVEAIAVDPSNPSHVYVTYHTEKVWFSPDAGKMWRRADKGVIRHGAHLYLWAIAPDPSGSTFYISTCGQGVLRNNVKTPENF